MHLSAKAAFIRNLITAGVNGIITLSLLLIAPLGLLAVIVNTFLVTLSTFLVCTAGDLVVGWLMAPGRDRFRMGKSPFDSELPRFDQQRNLDRRDR